jgi:anti-sigma28 factor (negative regulator of flagellin synthesis)
MKSVNTAAARADDSRNERKPTNGSAPAPPEAWSSEERRLCHVVEVQAKIEDGAYSVDSLALSKTLIEKHLVR